MSPIFLGAAALAALSAGLLAWLGAQSLLARIPANRPDPSLAQPAWKYDRAKFLAALGVLGLFLIALRDGVFGFWAALTAALAWFLLKKVPLWKSRLATRKKQSEMRELFPQTLGMAVQSLKTGQTIPQVLEYLSQEGPSPLKEEWRVVCAEMNFGSSAEQALSKMNGRFPGFIELNQFLESYRISRQTGANIIHLLEVLVEGMEEKNRLLRKMEALTAQARLSGLMIGLLPLLLAIVFFIMDPSLILPLFTEKIGWAILLLAGFLESLGFLWIRQLLRLEN